MTGHAANPDTEVTLTEDETHAVLTATSREAMFAVIRSIVADRLAPVKAELEAWKHSRYYMAVRAEAAEQQAADLRDRVMGHEAMRWPEEAHRLQQQRNALRAELDELRASIEALAGLVRKTYDAGPEAYTHGALRQLHYQVASDMLALLDNPGTALDAVRAEAKAEALREAARDLPLLEAGNEVRAYTWLRDRADALTDTTGGA